MSPRSPAYKVEATTNNVPKSYYGHTLVDLLWTTFWSWQCGEPKRIANNLLDRTSWTQTVTLSYGWRKDVLTSRDSTLEMGWTLSLSSSLCEERGKHILALVCGHSGVAPKYSHSRRRICQTTTNYLSTVYWYKIGGTCDRFLDTHPKQIVAIRCWADLIMLFRHSLRFASVGQAWRKLFDFIANRPFVMIRRTLIDWPVGE